MHEKLNITILPMVIGAFAAALDNNVLNICLPLLVKEFQIDMGMAQFVSSSYVFAICSLLLFFAYISSAVGRKYIFSIGVTVFSFSSLAAAFSSNIYVLIILRIAQGIGAAMFMANGMALINSHFADNVKGRAFGIIFTATSVASIVGPIIGGAIATLWGWRTNFLLIAPLGIAAALLATKFLQKENKHAISSFDIKGTVSSIVFVLLFFAGFLILKSRGGFMPIVLLAASLACLWFFIRAEKIAPNPVMQTSVFSQKVFVIANLQAGLVFAIMMAVGIILPVYIQESLGYIATYSGFVLSFMAMSTFAVSYYGGFMADKSGTHRIVSLGVVLVLIGMIGLGCAVYFGLKWLLFIGNIFVGGGIGFFNPANNKLVMMSVPREYAATAASINVLLRNAGIAVGTTISGMSYGLFLTLSSKPAVSALLSISIFIAVSVLILASNLSRKNNTIESTNYSHQR